MHESERLAERLSRFTPDGSGLDRDGLLFAAGRASARPNRRWVALAGSLAACQLLTLALLWPRPAPPVVAPVADVAAPRPIEPPPPSLGPRGAWPLREQAIASEGNLPSSPSVEPLVPSEPPLRAFGALPASLL